MGRHKPSRIPNYRDKDHQKFNREEEEMLMAIASGSAESPRKQIMRMEMDWLVDPRELASRVSQLLKDQDLSKAAALVRESQKQGVKCVVAWNFLIKYCLEKGYSRVAYKFFNDMKKRGGKPNPQTFTVLLSGLRDCPSRGESQYIIELAESIYRSISAPNSSVKLDVTHINVMLSVCQRHGDMDAMWRIASDLPESGAASPDMTTYTTILGAILFAARTDIEKMKPWQVDEILARKTQMVKEGKRIWADVVYMWTNDGYVLDEQVVNAMAMLLLDGATEGDFYDVFSLYHQTMGIPLFAKPPTDISKDTTSRKYKKPIKSKYVDETVPFMNEDGQMISLRQHESETLKVEDEEEENFDSLFEPVVPGNENLSYIKPGSKELTLIEDACFNMTQGSAAGVAYWNHLTVEETPYRIDPDNLAINQYLRLLRVMRSSKKAVAVLRDQMIPSGQISGKSFHIALSCCRRDIQNFSVLLNANELLHLMGESMVLPDPRVLQGYLQLVGALAQKPQMLMGLKGLDVNMKRGASRLDTLGKELQAKLRLFTHAALRPHFLKLHEALEGGSIRQVSHWSAAYEESGLIMAQSAIKAMAWVRLMVDDVLAVEYKAHISKEARKILEADSKMLRKYSNQELLERFEGKTLRPTTAQWNSFREGKAEKFDEASKEVQLKQTKKVQPEEQTEEILDASRH
ncbi:hypothetical protein N7495_000262 [Penicillium taxi]|uniref:uncharacterized protein n=1 Tax=Penicillium taxi TaxID=168475 RepID=UPI002545B497|nr:uncharacterized protein N7495_000262 [Penicillium taxi]KAJ5907580.1 hypothetical protein N7495_000262 [Penicillium taxi]